MARLGTKVFLGMAAGLVAANLALAQHTFPVKPIHVIAPYAAGGLLDATVRAVAQEMSKSIGQPVVVENRPGGNTFIGMQACAKAAPDGYTVCVTTPDSLSYNPHLFKNIPYDVKDFAPVTNLVIASNVFVAQTGAPFNSFKEMVDYAKANPGKVSWGTWGIGSTPHIYLEAVTRNLGVDILQVPYKGAGQAFPAVLAGDVHVTYGGLGFSIPYFKSGRLKPLAITPETSSLVPGVPSMKELGVEPGLPNYFGVFAPARTPEPVLDRLAAEFAKALRTPKLREFLTAQTLTPVGNSRNDFADFVKTDRANAERVFNSMGLKPLDAQ